MWGRVRLSGRLDRPLLVGSVTGLVVFLVLEGWFGLAAGLVLGGGMVWWLRRRPTRAALERDRQVQRALPFAADLLAATLRAGAPPQSAVAAVGAAIGGALGERLGRVERALRLGAPAGEAWSYLGDSDGARRIGEAAVRSQHSGSAFAGALARVADDLRADRLVHIDAAAARAGVLIVLPLGLCFLPAFVLAGLVPVIVAVLGDVLSP